VLSGQAAVAGNGSTVARKTASMQAQLDASMVDSTASALQQNKFLAKFQACYNAGGKPSIVSVNPDKANTINAWATGRVINDKNTTLTGYVDVLQTSFGTVKVQLNRLQPSADLICYDPELAKLAWLRPWQTTELAKTGDSEKTMLLGEFGLKNMHQFGHFALRNLTA
jgi:hypothetical protein